MLDEIGLQLKADFAEDLRRTKGFTIPDPMPPLPSPNLLTRYSLKMQDVITAVCQVANISKADLLAPRRTPRFTRYRAMVSLMAYDHCGLSSVEIGDSMHRDHTTILHAVKRGRELLKDPEFRAEYDQALRMLA